MADLYKTVAFLDFLGFRNFIENTPLIKLVEKYQRVISIADSLNRNLPNDKRPTIFPNLKTNDPYCRKKVFSDSIILISNNDSLESSLMLLIYTWKIMRACLATNMPLRGGIVFGEFFMDEKQDIFLGKALTNAYELESKQNWIGISIDESVEKRFNKIFTYQDIPLFQNVFLKYDVPLKDGSAKQMRTINWRFNYVVEKGTKSLMPISNNSNVNEKITNTLKYAKYVVKSGEVYTSKDIVSPVEFSVFWVGSNEPPFKHGDEY
jgi:hypothetical protein